MKTSGFDELITKLDVEAERDPEVKAALEEGRAWAKQVIDNLLKDLVKRHRSFRRRYAMQIADRSLKLFKSNLTRIPKPKFWYPVEKSSYSKSLSRYPRYDKLIGWHKQCIKTCRIGVWLYTKR
jgi:hypothetical protein